MDLDLDIIRPRILGKVSSGPPTAHFARNLMQEDVVLLNQPRGPGFSTVERFRARHHAAARMFAQNYSISQVSTSTGLAYATLATMRCSPAFKELIASYATSMQVEDRSNFERLSNLAATAADILTERMEESPDDVSTGQLTEIVKVAADRSGNGPVSSSINMNINANLADRLKAARERARAASQPQLIEAAHDDAA